MAKDLVIYQVMRNFSDDCMKKCWPLIIILPKRKSLNDHNIV